MSLISTSTTSPSFMFSGSPSVPHTQWRRALQVVEKPPSPAGRGDMTACLNPKRSLESALALSHHWIAQDANVVDFDLHDITVLHVLRVPIGTQPEHIAGV